MLSNVALNAGFYFAAAHVVNTTEGPKHKPTTMALYSAINTIAMECVLTTAKLAAHTLVNCDNGNCFNGYADADVRGLPAHLSDETKLIVLAGSVLLSQILAIKIGQRACEFLGQRITARQIFLYGAAHFFAAELLTPTGMTTSAFNSR